MDKPGLVTSTGPARMGHLLTECVRKSLASASGESIELAHAYCEIEYIYDGNVIPESKVFATDSQKGN